MIELFISLLVRGKKMFYLVNESAGYLGNSPYFWRKGGSGYSQWLDEAQRFTEKEVDKIIESTSGTHQWAKYACEDIDPVARLTVDVQDLQKMRK